MKKRLLKLVGMASVFYALTFSQAFADEIQENTVSDNTAIIMKGDVNLDGEINAEDLTTIARHVAKIQFITDETALYNADINNDSIVDSADMTAIARHVSKIELIVTEGEILGPDTPVPTATLPAASVTPPPEQTGEIDPDTPGEENPTPTVLPGEGNDENGEEEEAVITPEPEPTIWLPPVSETGNTVERLIAIAEGELGYMEKATNEYLEFKEFNAGDANYTKYANDIDVLYPDCYSGNKNGFGWCDVFVDWCFIQAYGYEGYLKLTCQPEASYGASCKYSMRYYSTQNRLFTDGPKVGDQVFFAEEGSEASNTGIVIEADDMYFYTIEGDSDNMVKFCQYEIGDSTVVGFGRPLYDRSGIAFTAEAVLDVARSQIGYKEKASNSNLEDFTANAGNKNFTKYAYFIDTNYPEFYNGKKNGYAWCDIFVDWCFIQAFGYEDALRLLCQPEKSLGAGCLYSMNYYKSQGRFYTSNPKPGDQIIFRSSDYPASHTGIVEKVDSTYVYTIEGNKSDQVKRCTYKLTDSTIVGYGRPDYDVE